MEVYLLKLSGDIYIYGTYVFIIQHTKYCIK